MSRTIKYAICICVTLILAQETYGQIGRGGIIRRIFRRQAVEEPESKEKEESKPKDESNRRDESNRKGDSKSADSETDRRQDADSKKGGTAPSQRSPKTAPGLNTAPALNTTPAPEKTPLAFESGQSRFTNQAENTFGLETKFDATRNLLLVRSVAKDSAAYTAGIRKGDAIQVVAGVPIEAADTLAGLAEVLSKGDVVQVEIVRKGKQDAVKLTVQEDGSLARTDARTPRVGSPKRETSTPEVLPLDFAQSKTNKSPSGLSSILELTPLSAPAPAAQPNVTSDVEGLRQTLSEQRAIIEEQNAEIQRLRRLLESRGR